MKYLLITALSIFSVTGLAHEHKDHKDWEKKWDKMSFEEAKAMKTEKLKNKSTLIQEAQSCVDAAKDKEALKTCMKNMKDKKKEMYKNMKDKMKKK